MINMNEKFIDTLSAHFRLTKKFVDEESNFENTLSAFPLLLILFPVMRH